jgi:hypothetical protein
MIKKYDLFFKLLPFFYLSIFLPAGSIHNYLLAATLHVGQGQIYSNLEEAAGQTLPGDTIMFHAGVYSGGQYIFGLQGTETDWITILAAPNDTVIVEGSGTAWQLSDPAFVSIEDVYFQHQSINGINIDDGGDYNTPAHHIRFVNCTLRDMNASGNNDLLKMSGVDHFQITECKFMNGSTGGSGIDMVGCHWGLIERNYFNDMGSNSIQAKGGSQYIEISQNSFINGGLRSLNLGGSTGLDYFRPIDAPFEAADLQVYSNIFVRSQAPVAFVGSINVEVVNNTIFRPTKWVTRILQESVDPDRFIECGDNKFSNNIVYIGNLGTETNIGPNTRPESFIYSNNLWFNDQDGNWSGPDIPVSDPAIIIGSDPSFLDTLNHDFQLNPSSPAIGKVNTSDPPQFDYFGISFNNPRSLGAIEGDPPTTRIYQMPEKTVTFELLDNYPNPFNPRTTIAFVITKTVLANLKIYNIIGEEISIIVSKELPAGTYKYHWNTSRMNGLVSGIYFYRLEIIDPSSDRHSEKTKKMILIK